MDDTGRKALDFYRDIPAAYAVFQVIPGESGDSAQNARYVFVNQRYCQVAGKEPEELLGRLFYEVYPPGERPVDGLLPQSGDGTGGNPEPVL